jgi:hypothetical protein
MATLATCGHQSIDGGTTSGSAKGIASVRESGCTDGLPPVALFSGGCPVCRRVAVAHGRDIIIGSLQQQAQLWKALLGNKYCTATQNTEPALQQRKHGPAKRGRCNDYLYVSFIYRRRATLRLVNAIQCIVSHCMLMIFDRPLETDCACWLVTAHTIPAFPVAFSPPQSAGRPSAPPVSP